LKRLVSRRCHRQWVRPSSPACSAPRKRPGTPLVKRTSISRSHVRITARQTYVTGSPRNPSFNREIIRTSFEPSYGIHPTYRRLLKRDQPAPRSVIDPDSAGHRVFEESGSTVVSEGQNAARSRPDSESRTGGCPPSTMDTQVRQMIGSSVECPTPRRDELPVDYKADWGSDQDDADSIAEWLPTAAN
jgi:hypothetical protein